MALELMDEHEKGERVRAWLRQNGSSIVTGIAVGLALIFGYQWWQGSKVEHRVTAATQYQALSDAVERNDTDAAVALDASLGKEYADTPYAVLAAFRVADAKLAAGEHDAALEALRRAGSAADPALASLSKLRQARVQLAAGKADDAIATLDALGKDDFRGLAAEIRGDALQALGRNDDAIAAYRDALTALDTGAPNRRMVEMKLGDLGGDVDQPEA